LLGLVSIEYGAAMMLIRAGYESGLSIFDATSWIDL
jgi:hypothetical protein